MEILSIVYSVALGGFAGLGVYVAAQRVRRKFMRLFCPSQFYFSLQSGGAVGWNSMATAWSSARPDFFL